MKEKGSTLLTLPRFPAPTDLSSPGFQVRPRVQTRTFPSWISNARLSCIFQKSSLNRYFQTPFPFLFFILCVFLWCFFFFSKFSVFTRYTTIPVNNTQSNWSCIWFLLVDQTLLNEFMQKSTLHLS